MQSFYRTFAVQIAIGNKILNSHDDTGNTYRRL